MLTEKKKKKKRRSLHVKSADCNQKTRSKLRFYGHFLANVDMQIVASGNGLLAKVWRELIRRAVIIAGPLSLTNGSKERRGRRKGRGRGGHTREACLMSRKMGSSLSHAPLSFP
ncbi:hypothetical protein CEXT_88901 [Caerostris extrusa]|uniref:Uncharacterized protein n=1 Tax=Caerostris extrusa TaxID=172846 RepID=A0AAV4YFB7_CAEEX|nr:hypothetical protein CEXT_88901 [Caerostris extrusa]